MARVKIFQHLKGLPCFHFASPPRSSPGSARWFGGFPVYTATATQLGVLCLPRTRLPCRWCLVFPSGSSGFQSAPPCGAGSSVISRARHSWPRYPGRGPFPRWLAYWWRHGCQCFHTNDNGQAPSSVSRKAGKLWEVLAGSAGGPTNTLRLCHSRHRRRSGGPSGWFSALLFAGRPLCLLTVVHSVGTVWQPSAAPACVAVGSGGLIFFFVMLYNHENPGLIT